MLCIQRFLARRAPAPALRPNTRRVPDPDPLPPAALLKSPDAEPAQRRGLHDTALHSVVWVDDTVFVTKTLPHPPCAGLVGGCTVCSRAGRAARQSQSWWHLTDELSLGLSEDKRQLPSQRVMYTGMVVDTSRRTISIPPDKESPSGRPGGFPRPAGGLPVRPSLPPRARAVLLGLPSPCSSLCRPLLLHHRLQRGP
jgi:hypothetical protein